MKTIRISIDFPRLLSSTMHLVGRNTLYRYYVVGDEWYFTDMDNRLLYYFSGLFYFREQK